MATEWFYTQRGKQVGPVSAGKLREMATDGTLQPSDLVWNEGMTDWKPASSLKGLFPAEDYAAAPVALPPRRTSSSSMNGGSKSSGSGGRLVSGSSLRDVVIHHRRMVILLLVGFFLIVLIACGGVLNDSTPDGNPSLIGSIFVLLSLPVGFVVYVLLIITQYRMAKALDMGDLRVILYTVAMFIPGLGLYAVLMLSAVASYVIRRAGLRIGFLVADPADVR